LSDKMEDHNEDHVNGTDILGPLPKNKSILSNRILWILKLYMSVVDNHLKCLYGKSCYIAQPYKLFASTYIKNEDFFEES